MILMDFDVDFSFFLQIYTHTDPSKFLLVSSIFLTMVTTDGPMCSPYDYYPFGRWCGVSERDASHSGRCLTLSVG
jgi:hypothetical protein